MLLKDYLYIKEIKIAQMAREINYARTYLNQIVLGRAKPCPKLIEKVETYTNNEVTAKDLVEHYEKVTGKTVKKYKDKKCNMKV